jgi:uncharacterized coiled-coil DUF342 family protein
MELISLTTAATAIATIFFTKVIEKPGENLGQELWDKTQNLIGRLKGKSDTLTNLLEGNKQQPLDYGEAVSELKELADKDPELAKAIKEIGAEVKQNPDFAQRVQKLAKAIQTQSPTIQNDGKLAEYIKQLFQGCSFFGSVTFN